MKEFYAEECGEDYGVLCWKEQVRKSVTKEILGEVLNLKIVMKILYLLLPLIVTYHYRYLMILIKI